MKYYIVVADDDSDDVQNLCEAFMVVNEECVVSQVANGVQLISYLYGQVQSGAMLPDAVILDLNMPKMDGLQALGVIKREKLFSDIAVVVYSTTSDAEQMNRCIEMGADAVASKGSRFAQIVSFAHEVIEILERKLAEHIGSVDMETKQPGRQT
jgi:CheY-like chemotaxis protein